MYLEQELTFFFVFDVRSLILSGKLFSHHNIINLTDTVILEAKEMDDVAQRVCG